jgi:hypothetical protein
MKDQATKRSKSSTASVAAEKKRPITVSLPVKTPAGAGGGLARLQQHNIAAKIPAKTEL